MNRHACIIQAPRLARMTASLSRPAAQLSLRAAPPALCPQSDPDVTDWRIRWCCRSWNPLSGEKIFQTVPVAQRAGISPVERPEYAVEMIFRSSTDVKICYYWT